jgi:hypothetical protein
VFENGVYKEIRRGIPCGYPRRRLRLFQKRRISLVRLQGVRALIFDLSCHQKDGEQFVAWMGSVERALFAVDHAIRLIDDA